MREITANGVEINRGPANGIRAAAGGSSADGDTAPVRGTRRPITTAVKVG